MKLTFGGLYLQFRSYLDHHFPNDMPTSVYLTWADIAAIRTVRSLYSISLTEAHTFVDDLTQNRAQPEPTP